MGVISTPVTNVNLKLVQSFLMVGEHKSFKSAAELLGLTQSAISAQVKTFEEQLGYPVFERTTRSVELTKKGAQLYEVAGTALKSINACLRSQEIQDRHKRGELRVACNSTFPTELLDFFLSALSTKFPYRKLTVVELQSEAIEEAVREDLVDLALTYEPSDRSQNFSRLFKSRLVAIVNASFDLQDAKVVSRSDLSGRSIFVYCENEDFGMITDLVRPTLTEGHEIFCRMSNAERLIQMVKRSDGFGIAWEHSLDANLTSGCRVVAFGDLAKQRSVGLLSRSSGEDWSVISRALSRKLAAECNTVECH